VLVVSSGGIFAPFIAGHHRGSKLAMTAGMFESESHRQTLHGRPKFDLCVCDLAIEDLGAFRELFGAMRPSLSEQARIVVFHHNIAGRALDELTYEFTRGLFPLRGRSDIAFAGSYPGALCARWFTTRVQRFNISRPAAVVGLAVTLAICAPLARLAAFLERRRPPHRLPRHCTSMTMVIDLP
jgi:hypothetical protein